MGNKEIRKIVKNYIAIIVTAVLLLFFVGNNTIQMVSQSRAADVENEVLSPENGAEGSGEGGVALNDLGGSEDDENGNEPDPGDDILDDNGVTPGGGSSNGDTPDEGNTDGEEGGEDDETSKPEEPDDAMVVAVIAYETNEGSKTAKYLSLADAFAGVWEVKQLVETSDDVSFIPKIVVMQSVTVHSDIAVPSDDRIGFEIDLNGKNIDCQNGACIDFRSCDVVVYDSTASTIVFDGETDNLRPGSVTGNTTTLFSGSGYGNLTLNSGYYANTGGTLANGFFSLTCNNVFAFSSGYYFTANVRNLQINGGFYQYSKLYTQDANTKLTVAGDAVLGETTIMINGYSTKGYGIVSANFKVVREQFGEDSETNPDYYLATFEDAFEKAIEVSAESGEVASIELVDANKNKTVAISKCYSMKLRSTAKVKIKGISFSRISSSGSPYTGQMFDVDAGKLILQDCTFDGYIGDDVFSVGSLFTVAKNAVLSLVGSDEVGTHIIRNTAKGVSSVDPCAAIHAKDGAIVLLKGYVVVNNNVAVTVDAQTSEPSRTPCNIFLESKAEVRLAGPIKTTEEKYIGITNREVATDDITVVGCLTDSYLSQIESAGVDTLKLASFFMDKVPSNTLKFDSISNLLYWEKESGELAEAGILRLEYILLLIGLILFILRNTSMIIENPEAHRYMTVLATIMLVAGTCFGFYHLRTEQMLAQRNAEIILDLKNSAHADETSMSEGKGLGEANELVFSTEEEHEAKALVPADGREYIGVIRIEDLGIELPVLASFSDADMKTTPCVYYGSRENNNLIIVGHNYDTQFGTFNSLSSKDTPHVTLTMLDGNVYEYETVGYEELNPNQVDEMIAGDWDLSLYTCSYSGAKRITLRCKLMR